MHSINSRTNFKPITLISHISHLYEIEIINTNENTERQWNAIVFLRYHNTECKRIIVEHELTRIDQNHESNCTWQVSLRTWHVLTPVSSSWNGAGSIEIYNRARRTTKNFLQSKWNSVYMNVTIKHINWTIKAKELDQIFLDLPPLYRLVSHDLNFSNRNDLYFLYCVEKLLSWCYIFSNKCFFLNHIYIQNNFQVFFSTTNYYYYFILLSKLASFSLISFSLILSILKSEEST